MDFQIEITGDSSFCPGVDRAFRITEETIFDQKNDTYSVGPLIHNPEVVSRLALLGLKTIDLDSSELPDLKGARVLIRSHGIDTESEQKLRDLGAVLVDATCPTVKRAQKAAAHLVQEGYTVLVLGSASHPEVRSIVGRAPGPVTVLESPADARRWIEEQGSRAGPVGIVCQTTISRDLRDSVVAVLSETYPDLEVRDTICEAVLRRRKEATELATRVDLMIVVGGRNSSNTSRLAEICEETGVPTRLIENPSELEPEWFESVGLVGVTGGASTPAWLIKETVTRLEEIAAT
jgi:small subunit ribosomal protein S1/4-hydroxy-3-methylbut-2-en-1-yl diphosphate reductase